MRQLYQLKRFVWYTMKIKEMAGSYSEVNYIPFEKVYGQGFDGMKRWIPCIEKIQKQVGYRQKTSLDETLEIIIDYLRKEEIKQDDRLQKMSLVSWQ